jgi:hypothetical protein
MEWLGELRSDADDPELQPVNPAVTQGFKAIVDEDMPVVRPASQEPAPERSPG